MELISQYFWAILFVFLGSSAFIYYQKSKKKDVEAQFVLTGGCLLAVFYTVCFLSGICTILNFLWRWVF